MIEYILVSLFHFGDMFFTVKYIQKLKKIRDNAEDMEMNYHRYFFKRFGLIKGAMISFMISLPLMNLIIYFNPYVKLDYFLIGICFGVMYVNYISWINFDEIMQVKVRC